MVCWEVSKCVVSRDFVSFMRMECRGEIVDGEICRTWCCCVGWNVEVFVGKACAGGGLVLQQ